MRWRRRQGQKERRFMEEVFVHVDALHRFALSLCRDPRQAEDLVQDALTRAYSAFERLREGTNHKAWVFTILRNNFISGTRRSGREVSLLPEHVASMSARGGGPSPLQVVESDIRYAFEDEVLAALNALSEKHRSAITLCDVDGMSYEEIGQIMGCPVGTVRSRIHHARRQLRASLESYAGGRGYGVGR